MGLVRPIPHGLGRKNHESVFVFFFRYADHASPKSVLEVSARKGCSTLVVTYSFIGQRIAMPLAVESGIDNTVPNQRSWSGTVVLLAVAQMHFETRDGKKIDWKVFFTFFYFLYE